MDKLRIILSMSLFSWLRFLLSKSKRFGLWFFKNLTLNYDNDDGRLYFSDNKTYTHNLLIIYRTRLSLYYSIVEPFVFKTHFDNIEYFSLLNEERYPEVAYALCQASIQCLKLYGNHRISISQDDIRDSILELIKVSELKPSFIDIFDAVMVLQ